MRPERIIRREGKEDEPEKKGKGRREGKEGRKEEGRKGR